MRRGQYRFLIFVNMTTKEPFKRDFVNCPICDEPGMRREWIGSESDGPYIFCCNIGCRSNGGPHDVRDEQTAKGLPTAGIMGFVQWLGKEGWYLHSVDRWCKGQSWPPADQCTEKELFEKWFGKQ